LLIELLGTPGGSPHFSGNCVPARCQKVRNGRKLSSWAFPLKSITSRMWQQQV